MRNAPVKTQSVGSLGLLALFGQGFGAMAPPYNCILVGAVIATFASKATPAVFLLAGVGILFYVMMIVDLSRHVQSSGGLYRAVQQGLGQRGALWYAGTLLANGVFTIPATVISSAYLLQLLFAHALPHHPAASALWLPQALLLLGCAVCVTNRGAELSGRVIVVVLVAGMAAIFGLDAAIFSHRGFAQIPWSSLGFRSAGVDPGGFLMGVGVGVLTYAGAEGAVFLSDEAADARRDIPRAVLLSVVSALAFYVITALAFATALPGYEIVRTWANGGALVLRILGQRYVNPWFGDVVMALIALAAVAGVISFINYIARLISALASDGYLPPALGTVNRHHAPVAAIATLAGASCVTFVVGLAVVGESAAGALTLFSWLYVSVTLFLLAGYLIVCTAAWRLASRAGASLWRRVVVPGMTFVLMLLAAVSQFIPVPPYPYDYAVWTAGGVLVVALIYTEWLLRKRAAATSNF